MRSQKELLSRLEELIQEGEGVRVSAKSIANSIFKQVDNELFFKWKTSCLWFLGEYFKKTIYVKTFRDKVKTIFLERTDQGMGVLNALKDNLVKGYLDSNEEEKFKKSEVVNYVDEERIKELASLPKDKFDTAKLVKLCEELNQNYKWKNYFAVGALLRTILNHVSPIFDKNKFEHVASNYEWGRSDKKSIMRLYLSAKNIADNLLHEHIKKIESLPKNTQVNFAAELDVLLGQIVIKLKS